MKSSSTRERERAVPPRPRPSAFQANRNATSNDIPRSTYKDVPRTNPKPQFNWPDPPAGVPPGLSRSNTTRVPRKGGFAPATPGGDEPMARNTSAYSNTPRTAQPHAPRAETQYPPPPPGPPPTSKNSEPPTSDSFRSFRSPHSTDDPFAHSDRLSTPYASMSGERTYFSSEGLNKSPSNRSNKGSGGLSSGFPSHANSPLSPRMPGRHRSASPNYRSPRPQQPDSSGESSSDLSSDEEVSAAGRKASVDHRATPRGPKVPPRDRYKPATLSSETDGLNDTPQHHTPGHSGPHDIHAHVDATPEGFFQHRMKREAEKAAHPASPLHTNAPWSNSTSQRPLEKSKSWHDKYGWTEDLNNQRKFDCPTTGESKEDHTMYDFSYYKSYSPMYVRGKTTETCESQKPKTSSGPWPHWAIPSSVVSKPQAEAGKTVTPCSNWNPYFAHSCQKANTTSTYSFNTGNGSAPAQPLRRPSSENINTTFSPSDWHGKFGDAEEFLGASSSGYTSGRASPPKGRASPSKGRSRNQPRTYSKTALPNGQAFGDGNPQMPPPPHTSVQAPSPGKASFSGEEWSQHFRESNWAFPPPPPPQSPRLGNPNRRKSLRKPSGTQQKRPVIPKPAAVTATIVDDKEELEDTNTALETERSSSSGNGSAMDIDLDPTPSNDQNVSRRHSAANVENSPLHQPPRTSSTPNTATDISNHDAGSHLDLNGFKDTAPFAPSKSGLKDLNDLSTTLPFESRSSIHVARPLAPQRLALPNPPKAPVLPDIVTQATWNDYAAYMRAYMAEWNIFNKKMLLHFDTRQVHTETKLGENWISAIGEDGYARYVQGIEEDIRVREHWDVSWEKHRTCMKDLGTIRQKVLKGKLN